MGQINFFVTKEETYDLIEELIISDLFLLYIGSFFETEEPINITSALEIKDTKRITIWIKNSLTKPKCSKTGAGEFAKKFMFDIYFDPIIEFDIRNAHDNLLSPSRLYYKAGWVKDNALKELHIKTTQKLVRTIKKKLISSEKLKPFYITKGTLELLDKGYELELGPGGRRINRHTLNGT
jgi:hypothetical protein